MPRKQRRKESSTKDTKIGSLGEIASHEDDDVKPLALTIHFISVSPTKHAVADYVQGTVGSVFDLKGSNGLRSL